jgi:hypothetical protein
VTVPTGPDKELFTQHPTLYFIAVGLKYGPARSHLVDAASEAGLMDGQLTAAQLKVVLYRTAAKLHDCTMIEWELRPDHAGFWPGFFWLRGFPLGSVGLALTLRPGFGCWLPCFAPLAQDRNVGHGVQYHQGPVLFLRRLGVVRKADVDQSVSLGRSGLAPKVCSCDCVPMSVVRSGGRAGVVLGRLETCLVPLLSPQLFCCCCCCCCC